MHFLHLVIHVSNIFLKGAELKAVVHLRYNDILPIPT